VLNVLIDIYKGSIRTLGFFAKETSGILRQPRLVGSLVLGPFLILLLFGTGFRGQQTNFRTILVVPSDPSISDDPVVYREAFMGAFQLQRVTRDEAQARRELRARQVDIVVIVPGDVYEQVNQGQQAALPVLYSETDPTQSAWINYFAYVQTSELNRRILVEVLKQSKGTAAQALDYAAQARLETDGPNDSLDALARRIGDIPTEPLVSPFSVQATNLVPVQPSAIAFYTPAVLALLLQHMAVTLAALSSVRDRLLGSMELFRVSPAGAGNILVGKSLAYLLLLGLVSVILTAASRLFLDVPSLGAPLFYWLSVGLTIFAAVGLGFALSAVAQTESQAVQLSLLVMLASVFFGGFFLPLDQLWPWLRAISYLLPVTYGVIDLREVMLRGVEPPWPLLLGPFLLGLVFYALAERGLHREMRRA
jgi:ABC-2 type transport system permease protein